MIVRGPFTLSWRGSILEDIESVEVEYDTSSEDYEANSGQVYEINKGIKAAIRLTLLANDIASLAAVLPQHFIAQNGILGDGSFVTSERGAIDIRPDQCDIDDIYGDLDLTSCGDLGENLRLKNARTIVDGFEVGKIRKIVVKFIGEPEPGQSLIQILDVPGEEEQNDYFQLGDNDLFILGDGDYLIL